MRISDTPSIAAARPHDPKCHGCGQPQSAVGALTLTVERTATGARSGQLCSACQASVSRVSIAGTSIVAFVLEQRAAHECPDCGKSRIVVNLNVARRRSRTRLERVSPETHCACVGGPAYAGIGSTIAGRAS